MIFEIFPFFRHPLGSSFYDFFILSITWLPVVSLTLPFLSFCHHKHHLKFCALDFIDNKLKYTFINEYSCVCLFIRLSLSIHKRVFSVSLVPKQSKLRQHETLVKSVMYHPVFKSKIYIIVMDVDQLLRIVSVFSLSISCLNKTISKIRDYTLFLFHSMNN